MIKGRLRPATVSSWRSAASTAVGSREHRRLALGVPPCKMVVLFLRPCSVAWARAFPACVPWFRFGVWIGTQSATTRAGRCGAADDTIGFACGAALPGLTQGEVMIKGRLRPTTKTAQRTRAAAHRGPWLVRH